MKALTIKQPWASLIMRGGKNIENRSWPTKYRGVVAIHSSARLEQSEMQSACDLMRGFVPRFSQSLFEQEKFPTGVILGTVEIVDCVKWSLSPWFCGQYGFVLRNAVAFKNPVKCSGARLFWTVPEDLLPAVNEQIAGAKGLL